LRERLEGNCYVRSEVFESVRIQDVIKLQDFSMLYGLLDLNMGLSDSVEAVGAGFDLVPPQVFTNLDRTRELAGERPKLTQRVLANSN
jgi:hypothetical protein